MPRSGLRVRPATADDLPALLAFGDELREQLTPSADGGLRRRGTPRVARALLESRYAEALVDPDRHLIVVLDGDGDEPIAMALLSVASANALVDLPAVHMSHSVVAARHKRKGAGRALVAAATAFADERGLEQIVVSVSPGSREANRFFARLGFAPLAVRRVAPVASVRRRLAQAEAPADHLVRRRPRRPARLPVAPAVPLGGLESDA